MSTFWLGKSAWISALVVSLDICLCVHLIRNTLPPEIGQEIDNYTEENDFVFDQINFWNEPLVVRRSNVTLKNLTASVQGGPNTPAVLLVVLGDNVQLSSFTLTGTADERFDKLKHGHAPLLVVRGNNASLTDGVASHCPGSAILILGHEFTDIYPAVKDISSCFISNIYGEYNGRDLLSLESAAGLSGFSLSGCTVSNITGVLRSDAPRGVLELSDGVRDIRVDGITAYGGRYALDIQDHGREGQQNVNLLINNIHGIGSEYVLRMAQRRLSKIHHSFTISNIHSTRCSGRPSVQIQNAKEVRIDGIYIDDDDDDATTDPKERVEVIGSSEILIENAQLNGAPIDPATHVSIDEDSKNVMVIDADSLACISYSYQSGGDGIEGCVFFSLPVSVIALIGISLASACVGVALSLTTVFILQKRSLGFKIPLPLFCS